MSPVARADFDERTLRPEHAHRRIALSTTLLGAALPLAAIAFLVDRKHAVLGYFVGVLFVVTIGIGALFFVLLHHLTAARWSAAARRHMEWVASVLPWSALLSIPIVFLAHDVFPWLDPAVAGGLGNKAVWFRPAFFFLRSAFLLASWVALSQWFGKRSLVYDEEASESAQLAMRRWSGPAMVLLGFTLTLASFDWVMSLTPHWESSIFGVYLFAGSVTSSLAVLALITLEVQKEGIPAAVSGAAHRHDIGKLLFAFLFFWAYIAFSQLLLIWYANLPRETAFYEVRWSAGWRHTTIALAALHFGFPFLVLLARTAKRSPPVLGAAAFCLITAHFVDLFWLVFPMTDWAAPSTAAIAAAVLPACVLFAVVVHKMARGPLYPPHDPDLHAAFQCREEDIP